MSSFPQHRVHRIATSVFFFVAGLCFASWASRIPDIQAKLKLSDAGLGSVLFALPVGLMASLPVSGWLVTKFGSKRILLVGGITYPLMLCCIGLTAYTWQLVIVLVFFGLASNLLNIAVNTQAVSVEAEYGRSIMASFHGVWSLAGFVGASIGSGMIVLHIIPLYHYLIVAALVIATVLLFQHKVSAHDLPHDTSQPLFVKPDKVLLQLGIIALCCMICEGSMFDWSGVYFRKEVVNVGKLSTLGYVAFMASMATGRFISDALVTRLGARRVLQVSGIVIACGLLLAIIFPYLVTATIGFLLVGFGVSSVVPVVYSVAGRSGTMAPGLALAAVSTIGYFGFLFGPPLIGFIAQAANLRWSLALIAVLGFCTTLMASKKSLKI
ncbi:MAG: MFS transporter [Filimonas sp.]|nr:MFS transporter [Filimonas sp.]